MATYALHRIRIYVNYRSVQIIGVSGFNTNSDVRCVVGKNSNLMADCVPLESIPRRWDDINLLSTIVNDVRIDVSSIMVAIKSSYVGGWPQ